MSVLALQVIAPVLTNYFHCMHCEQLFHHAGIGQQLHQEMLEDYPEEIKEQAQKLATWLLDLSSRYSDRIHVRVVDPQSLEGLFLSLRHWARKYPTFIINGKKAYVGSDREDFEEVLQTYFSH